MTNIVFLRWLSYHSLRYNPATDLHVDGTGWARIQPPSLQVWWFLGPLWSFHVQPQAHQIELHLVENYGIIMDCIILISVISGWHAKMRKNEKTWLESWVAYGKWWCTEISEMHATSSVRLSQRQKLQDVPSLQLLPLLFCSSSIVHLLPSAGGWSGFGRRLRIGT